MTNGGDDDPGFFGRIWNWFFPKKKKPIAYGEPVQDVEFIPNPEVRAPMLKFPPPGFGVREVSLIEKASENVGKWPRVIGASKNIGMILSNGYSGSFADAIEIASKAIRSGLSNSREPGLTKFGKELKKHALNRPNSYKWDNMIPGGRTKDKAFWNEVGFDVFKEIWRAPGYFRYNVNDGFMEKILPDGRGIRLQRDGTFKGFIDH